MAKPEVKKGSVLIQVLGDDIKHGIVGNGISCPLGRAFNRDLVGSVRVIITYDHIHVFWGTPPKRGRSEWSKYLMPEKLKVYAIAFDTGEKVRSMDFGFDPNTGEVSDVIGAAVSEPTPEEQKRDPFVYDPTPGGQGLPVG